jgi:CRP/FNR family transcriptional regulator, anaerobic regulatory protein
MLCNNCDCPFSEFRAGNGPLSALQITCIIADAVQKVVFKPGEMLFLQGQSSSSLYSLTNGMVKICSHSADGREQIVGLSSPGNLLLGLQSMSEDRYAYTAVAETAVHACKINHRILLAHVHDMPDLAMRLIAAMNAQLAHSRAMMEVMGHKCAAAKVASFILLMTPKAEHGNCNFPMPFSRMEMASILGLSEETVCRIMANIKRAGAVYAPRGKIEIRNWNQLHAIAEGDLGVYQVSRSR